MHLQYSTNALPNWYPKYYYQETFIHYHMSISWDGLCPWLHTLIQRTTQSRGWRKSCSEPQPATLRLSNWARSDSSYSDCSSQAVITTTLMKELGAKNRVGLEICLELCDEVDWKHTQHGPCKYPMEPTTTWIFHSALSITGYNIDYYIKQI